MTDRPSWAPIDIDHTRPSVARVYDFYLGGSHNFESDRAFGQQVIRQMPQLPMILRDNRHFLRRVVLHLCEQGVDQFLDLGSGIPTVGNVHEVAQEANPQARIVYVDHDPVAVTHSAALLHDNDLATVIAGDLREPRRVLEDAVGTGLLDLSRPVGVLMVSVLHFVHDEERPAELIAEFMGAVAPGSYLGISHARLDGQAELRDVAKVYDKSRSLTSMRLRTRQEVEALFGDLTIVEPGVVLIPRWHPETAEDGDENPEVPEDYPGFGAVGRRD